MASKRMMTVLFSELEQECLNTVRYIEALKVERLSKNQKEDILFSDKDLTLKRQLITTKTQRAQRNTNAYENKESNQIGELHW